MPVKVKKTRLPRATRVKKLPLPKLRKISGMGAMASRPPITPKTRRVKMLGRRWSDPSPSADGRRFEGKEEETTGPVLLVAASRAGIATMTAGAAGSRGAVVAETKGPPSEGETRVTPLAAVGEGLAAAAWTAMSPFSPQLHRPRTPYRNASALAFPVMRTERTPVEMTTGVGGLWAEGDLIAVTMVAAALV